MATQETTNGRQERKPIAPNEAAVRLGAIIKHNALSTIAALDPRKLRDLRTIKEIDSLLFGSTTEGDRARLVFEAFEQAGGGVEPHKAVRGRMLALMTTGMPDVVDRLTERHVEEIASVWHVKRGRKKIRNREQPKKAETLARVLDELGITVAAANMHKVLK